MESVYIFLSSVWLFTHKIINIYLLAEPVDEAEQEEITMLNALEDLLPKYMLRGWY